MKVDDNTVHINFNLKNSFSLFISAFPAFIVYYARLRTQLLRFDIYSEFYTHVREFISACLILIAFSKRYQIKNAK